MASFYFSTRRGSETVAEYHCRNKSVRGSTVPAVWRGPKTDTSEHRVSVLTKQSCLEDPGSLEVR